MGLPGFIAQVVFEVGSVAHMARLTPESSEPVAGVASTVAIRQQAGGAVMGVTVQDSSNLPIH